MPDLNQLLNNLKTTAKKAAKVTFAEASTFRMPYGKHNGQTIDDIGSSDEGLRYLDWLRGEIGAGEVLDKISVYLDDPTIASSLDAALEEDD